MTEDQQKNAETAQAEAAEAAKAQAAAEETAEKAQAAEADQAEAKDEKAAAPDPKDEKIAQQEQQIADLQNRLLRLQADFENFRRRTANEKAELSTYVTMDVVAKFLKILDNFERAEASAETAQDIKSVTDGMSAIMKQFQKTLDDLGVKEIPAEGQKFDPKYHEAVMRGQNPDLEEDTIDAVFEKGYELNDKVIRHSKVRVISKE